MFLENWIYIYDLKKRNKKNLYFIKHRLPRIKNMAIPLMSYSIDITSNNYWYKIITRCNYRHKILFLSLYNSVYWYVVLT